VLKKERKKQKPNTCRIDVEGGCGRFVGKRGGECEVKSVDKARKKSYVACRGEKIRKKEKGELTMRVTMRSS